MTREVNLAKLKSIIGFVPHEKQKDILRNMRRFTTVVGGRRLGKTILASYIALRELFASDKAIWILGPNKDLASRSWEYLEKWIDLYFPEIFRVNRHEHIIENLMTKSTVWLKTAETPESLRGKGLDLVIIDEASLLPNGIYDSNIRPNVLDKKGKVFLISNPFGFNWFYDLYLRGLPEGQIANSDHISFTVPTAIEDIDGNIIGSNNPEYVEVEELKSIKKNTPVDIWRQEYLSVFQEGAGQRFKNFETCIDDSIQLKDSNEWFEAPKTGHLYYLGIDIAKMEDFTVVCVMDRMTHRLVGFWRINSVSWDLMREKIKEVSQRYFDAEIILDATGNAGDMFTENLAEIGVNVDTEFKYTNRTKMMLIDKLSLFMERGQLRFPRIPQLVNEIRSFTYHVTDSGTVKYGSSRKDDCVNALALSCWNLNDAPLDGDTNEHNLFIPKKRSFY